MSLYNKIANQGSLDSNTVTDENSGITVTTTDQNNIKTINVLNIDTIKRIETNIYQNNDSPLGHSEIQYKGHVLTIDYHVDDPSLLSQTAIDVIDAQLMNVELFEMPDGSVQVQIPKELIESIAANSPTFRFDNVVFSPTVIQDDPLISWDVGEDEHDPFPTLSSLGLKQDDLTLEIWAKWDNQEIKLAQDVKLPDHFTLSPKLYSNGLLLSQQDVENDIYRLAIQSRWLRAKTFDSSAGNIDPLHSFWYVDQEYPLNFPDRKSCLFVFFLYLDLANPTENSNWIPISILDERYYINYVDSSFSGSGSASDPSGDAYEYSGSNYGPSADLIGAIITVYGDQANFSVSYSAGTFDPKLSRASFSLDTDQNPNTGSPGVDSGGNDDGFIGAEYILTLGSRKCENYGAYVLEYAGTPHKFNLVGSFYLKPSINGFSIDLPLSIFGEDDGRMNFKVTSSARIDGTCYYQGCVDYMPDLGLPATEVR